MKKFRSVILLFTTIFTTVTTLTNETFSADKVKTNNQEEISLTPSTDNTSYGNAAVQILNKTTAKTDILELKIKKKTTFGNIAIIAHQCWQSPLEEKPESKMLLEIFETKTNQPEKRIFYGWMFASSPSISSLEHQVYDITALNCKSTKK